MSEPLYFDDLHEGDSWTSRGRTVTETDVVSFAGLTGDYDPLHVDHEFASRTPFGQRVAHGLLGLSFLAGLSSTCPAVQTTAFLRIRDWEFKKPVFIGDTIRAVTTVTRLAATSPRHGHVVWQRQLVNQHDEVVQEGFLETLVATSQSAAGKHRTMDPRHQPRPHKLPRALPRDEA